MTGSLTVTSAGKKRSSTTAQIWRDVVKREKNKQAEASADLIVSLREMVNNPAFSDVVFLCNDGESVRASRMLLASRSEVLRSMLANGMAESGRDKITLAAVSSPVMLSVLEFLYTGTMASYNPQSWKMGWEVLIASQFFLLPTLEHMIRELIVENISILKGVPEELAILLTEAMGFKDLCSEADDIFKLLHALLSLDWSDSCSVKHLSCFVKHLSEDAFHYLLANSKSDIEHVDMFSFREYFRFRGVIQWWVYQSNLEPAAGEQLMTFLVPDKGKLLFTCEFPDCAPKLNELEICWANLQADKIPMVAATRLLSNIDFHLIHPVLLAKMVEPLHIYSGEILDAFRFQALRSTVAFKVPICRWRHGPSYNTFENGHIYRTGITSSSAIILNPILRSDINEWEFVIEFDCDVCDDFAELGLVPLNFSELHEKLSDDANSFILKSDEEKITVSKGNATRNWKTLHDEPLYSESKVSFKFDGTRNECSLTMNGKDFGVIWKNLENDYHPAVSFGNCTQQPMRVRLLRGFDLDDY